MCVSAAFKTDESIERKLAIAAWKSSFLGSLSYPSTTMRHDCPPSTGTGSGSLTYPSSNRLSFVTTPRGGMFMAITSQHALRYSGGRDALASTARPSEYLRACHPV